MHGLKHSINKELDSRLSVSGFNTPEVIVLYHVLGIKHPLTVQGSKGITVNWQRNIGWQMVKSETRRDAETLV